MTVSANFTLSPSVGGLDLNGSNTGCARLGGEVAPPLGVVFFRSFKPILLF